MKHKFTIGETVMLNDGEIVKITAYQTSIAEGKSIPSYWCIFSRDIFSDGFARNVWESSIKTNVFKGLLVDVFRWSYDCTNNGVSKTRKEFLLIGKGITELFTETDPAKVLIYDVKESGYKYCYPAIFQKNEGMAGGNFVYSSDSRFPNQYPISIHDRKE